MSLHSAYHSIEPFVWWTSYISKFPRALKFNTAEQNYLFIPESSVSTYAMYV